MLDKICIDKLLQSLSFDNGRLIIDENAIETMFINIAVNLSDVTCLEDMEEITTDTEQRTVKVALKSVKSLKSDVYSIKDNLLKASSKTVETIFSDFLSKADLLEQHFKKLIKAYEEKMGTGSVKRAETLAAKKAEKQKAEEAERSLILTFKCPNEDAKAKLLQAANILGCIQL